MSAVKILEVSRSINKIPRSYADIRQRGCCTVGLEDIDEQFATWYSIKFNEGFVERRNRFVSMVYDPRAALYSGAPNTAVCWISSGTAMLIIA
jgi:hypothetical protein